MNPEDLRVVVALGEGEAVALRCAVVASHAKQNLINGVVGNLCVGVGLQQPLELKREKFKTQLRSSSQISLDPERPPPSPDDALRHAWHRKGNIQRDLALPSENAHHTQGLHLAAGGIDRGAAQIRQLAEHHAVLVWDGADGTAV